MERRRVNPWGWQDEIGYSQAIETTGGERILHCSGQTSMDTDGSVVHAGDMRAQVAQSMDNIEAVLSAAGYDLRDVVRLDCYTTDPDELFDHWDVVIDRLERVDCQPTCTLLGVNRLAFPELLVEIEPMAVK